MIEQDEGSHEGYTPIELALADAMHTKLPACDFRATPGALERGWRLLDPEKEHLELRTFPRGPTQFRGFREGVRFMSPLTFWEKLFPDEFLKKLLEWNLAAEHAEHFRYPDGTKIKLDRAKVLTLYAHRLYIMATAQKPLGQTLEAAHRKLEDDLGRARMFFIESGFKPKKCSISALKSLFAHFFIPHELEHEINSNLASLLVQGTVPSLCGDETAPGNTGAAPFIRLDPNKPHELSMWYQTVAVPTSLANFDFCCRVRTFKAESSRGISDPPQGMTEEMALLALETGGILCVDSLYATRYIVEQFPKWVHLNNQCGFIASLHSSWFEPLTRQIPKSRVRQQGQWAILVRPLPAEPPAVEPAAAEPPVAEPAEAEPPAAEPTGAEPPAKRSKSHEFFREVAQLANNRRRPRKQATPATPTNTTKRQREGAQLVECISDAHVPWKGDTTHKYTFASGVFVLKPGSSFRRGEEKKNIVYVLYNLLFNRIDLLNRKLYNYLLSTVHRRSCWRGSMDDLFFTLLTLNAFHLFRVINKDQAAGWAWAQFLVELSKELIEKASKI
jgi:hypothetical protein